jgi:hypothetical protein
LFEFCDQIAGGCGIACVARAFENTRFAAVAANQRVIALADSPWHIDTAVGRAHNQSP